MEHCQPENLPDLSGIYIIWDFNKPLKSCPILFSIAGEIGEFFERLTTQQETPFQWNPSQDWTSGSFDLENTNSSKAEQNFFNFSEPFSNPINQFSIDTEPQPGFFTNREYNPSQLTLSVSDSQDFVQNSQHFCSVPKNLNHHIWDEYREKNNTACRKYREKRKGKEKSLKEELSSLKEINSNLHKTLEAKKTEIRQLQSVLLRQFIQQWRADFKDFI